MNILDVKNSGWYDIKRKVDIAVSSYCLQVELMIEPLENDVAQCSKSKPPTEVKQANIHSFLLGFSFVVLSASAAVTAFSVLNSSVIVSSFSAAISWRIDVFRVINAFIRCVLIVSPVMIDNGVLLLSGVCE